MRTWRSGGIKAPHKPLLLLYTLAKVMGDEPRLLNYGNIKDEGRELLMEFAPPRKLYRPSYPFLRLHNDDIWEIKGKEALTPNKIGVTEILLRIIPRGFTEEIYSLLNKNPILVCELAKIFLVQNFPRDNE